MLFFVDYFDYNIKIISYHQCCVTANRRTVIDYRKSGLTPDLPDGMTTDVNDNLWIASYYAGKVKQNG